MNENFQSSRESIDKSCEKVYASPSDKNGITNGIEKNVEAQSNNEPPPTSYLETLMHLFKGNVGTGCFAMADAIKNSGLILGSFLTLFLGVVCVHAQHILLQCSAKMKLKYKLTTKPDYAETVELCFLSSNSEKWRKLAPAMKTICNCFIVVTQLGFCCIYFLFVGTNLKQILDFYGFNLSVYVLVAAALIPIWLSTLITNLKYLGEEFHRHRFYVTPSNNLIISQFHVRVLPTFA